MKKNPLLEQAEILETNIELLYQNNKIQSNIAFQIRKASSCVFANISEANYGQSKPDMISKFEIAIKETAETESRLRLLLNSGYIDEEIFKLNRNLCCRRRMLISSVKTMKNS